MRTRWKALDRETQAVVGLAIGFVLFRILVASLSGFGFHQGWNEGHYALIGRGFLDHPLVPRYGKRFVYSVPPLFPYTISAAFLLFGESTLAARLPSILATGGLIVVTYELGRELFDSRSTAAIGAGILATLPYVQLYGGRAQTDILMVFFITASITAIVKSYRRETAYRYWLLAGAALFAAAVATKQPALGVAGVILFWLLGNLNYSQATIRRTALLIVASAVCLLPLFAWLYLNYRLAPAAFVADWERELFGRTRAFANVRLLVVIGLGIGMTPLVLACSTVGVVTDLRETVTRYRERRSEQVGPSLLLWWLLLFGLFVFARGPQGHQYYAVVLAPPIALLAASGVRTIAHRLRGISGYEQQTIHTALIVILLLSTLGGTAVLFELSGEFSLNNGGGTHVAGDASSFVVEEVPEDATLLVANEYAPPVKWYIKNEHSVDLVVPYYLSSLSEQRIQSVSKNSTGPVYLISPSEVDIPSVEMKQVHTTARYEYTLMSYVGMYTETDSKFKYYLNDRQLVVYRVVEV